MHDDAISLIEMITSIGGLIGHMVPGPECFMTDLNLDYQVHFIDEESQSFSFYMGVARGVVKPSVPLEKLRTTLKLSGIKKYENGVHILFHSMLYAGPRTGLQEELRAPWAQIERWIKRNLLKSHFKDIKRDGLIYVGPQAKEWVAKDPEHHFFWGMDLPLKPLPLGPELNTVRLRKPSGEKDYRA
jgi:hypothetical protein